MQNRNSTDYISPSQLVNYILKDPLIDFLNYYKIETIHDLPDHKRVWSNILVESDFTKMIKKKGIEYENNVIIQLDQILLLNNKKPIYKINQNSENDKINETILALSNKEPIIYQGGILYNNLIYGVPDLIIRGDYLNFLYNENVNEKLYYIIDIKFSTVKLSANEDYICNSDMAPVYKCQVLLYTQILNKLLNQNVNIGFIHGKKYSCKKEKINNNIRLRLATINYDTFDVKYYELLDNAIKWINRLKNEGSNWVLLPKPSIPELYPNMCNKRDDKWRPLKKQLADEIKDLTLIFNVSYENRLVGFSNNIYSYDSPDCCCDKLNIRGKKKDIIDKIIQINSNNNNILVSPNKINFNKTKWRKLKKNQLEFYLDYETTCDYYNTNFIFMIGVGYINNDNLWIFKNFKSKTSELIDQEEMYKIFWDNINQILIEMKKKEGVFFHWSHAEPAFYSKSSNQINLPDKNFLDLYQLFINEPIVVKSAFNYSLKTISKALHSHGLIDTLWDSNSSCSNGLEVLYQANQYYFENVNINFNDIIYYNEIDCKVLYEILKYLRLNH